MAHPRELKMTEIPLVALCKREDELAFLLSTAGLPNQNVQQKHSNHFQD